MTDNSDILNKAWTDDAFMDRLEKDPRAALAETGHEVPEDVEVRLVRDSDNVRYLHVPTAPYEGELSDTDLMGANAGFITITAKSLTLQLLTHTFSIPKSL